MARDPKRREPKKAGGPGPGVGPKAIESNTAIAALAMKGAKPPQRLLVYVCYGIILIVVTVLAIPPYESGKQLIASGAGVLCLFVAFIMVLRRYRELSEGSVPLLVPPERGPQTVQLSNVVHERVGVALEDARRAAYGFLREKKPNLSDDQVRANIFFPDYGPSGDLRKYVLKICPGLHRKMDQPREVEITFEPGQGATGKVFESRQARVTQRLDSGSEDWDEVYDITDELAARIHPDLKWIISMPLKDEDGKSIGVMNIDGLRHQLPLDVLYECMAKVTIHVIFIARLVIGN